MATESPLFTFAFVTDLHFDRQHDPATPLVKGLNAGIAHPRPDFVVFNADTIDGHPDLAEMAWQNRTVKSILDGLEMPYYTTCHSHDVSLEKETTPDNTYRRAFGGEAYDFIREFPGGFAGIFMSGCYVDDLGNYRDLKDGDPVSAAWLRKALDGLKGRKVLFFYHFPVFIPRKPVDAELRRQIRPEMEAHYFSMKKDNPELVRSIISAHGGVAAHYAGHCHVNSLNVHDGTYYVTTSALRYKPCEYLYVRVFQDRIEHRLIRGYDPGEQPWFWGPLVDEDHLTPEAYHGGNPDERDFVIAL